MTTTVDHPALGLTLTQAARASAAQLSGRRYRNADTGAWCSPTTPHVPDCTCQPGEDGCGPCWDAYLRHAANRPAAT